MTPPYMLGSYRESTISIMSFMQRRRYVLFAAGCCIAAVLSLTSCAPYAGLFDNDSRVSTSVVRQAEALLEDRPIQDSRYLTEYKDYEFFAFLITDAEGREEPCLAWFGPDEADSQITCTTGGAVSGLVPGVGEATFYVEGIAESKAKEHTHGVAINPYIVVEDASGGGG